MDKKKLKKATVQALKPLYRALPIMIGIIILISLVSYLIPKETFSYLFTGNLILDPIIASFLGSILAGNPVNSYILGGEFLDLGINLVAVTAFLISWVTVGIVQLPAEMVMLGRKFSIIRNILSFIFSILIAIATVLIIGVI